MKIAVTGIGYRAISVLNDLFEAMPEAEVVGYVDPNPILLHQLKQSKTPEEYNTPEEMIDDCSPDMLFVGSPNHLHLEQIKLGLETGLRVFSEKPVVGSMDHTWELADLLMKHGADRLMVGLVLRYSQHMFDLKAAMDAGYLGKLISLEANEHIAPYHGAFFMKDWRRHPEYSGGFMLEKCCHDLDLYNMITGSRPVQVASFGGRRTFLPENAPHPDDELHEQYDQKPSLWSGIDSAFQVEGDIVDHQTALLKYENGIPMAFHANLHAPEKQRRFCLFGTEGMAEGEFQKGYLKVTTARSGRPVVDIDYQQGPDSHLKHYGADARMACMLTDYLRGETGTLPVSARQAMESGIVALKIDEARVSGNVLDLSETWKRLDALNFDG